MQFELKNKAILTGIKPKTERAIKNRLTMPNPKYDEAQKMGRHTGGIPQHLTFYSKTVDELTCPRGAAGQIYRICQGHGEEISIIDQRRTLSPVDFDFLGGLRDYQAPAVDSVLSKDFGLLEAPTGSGKTAMALYLIAQRQQPALIMVHTKELLNQWADRIKSFLGIAPGIIGGGKHDIQPVTVATVQTLVKVADELAPFFGYLIADECHRAPAMQYVRAVEAFDCRYMTGLTATPYRRDGLSKVIFWHVGDVTGKVDKAELVQNGNLCPASVRWIKTEFETNIDASEFYSKALSDLVQDDHRNRLIAKTVAENNGHGISLVLSDRKAHCEEIHDRLFRDHGIESEVLTGSTAKTERERIVKALHAGDCQYLVATGQLIGEGFDLPGISSMYLTTPIKFPGRVIQYIGRALRPAPGKDRAYIYDFVDVNNPVFKASARKRTAIYQQEGVEQ